MFKKPLFILTVVAVIAISGIYMYSQSKSTDIKLTETTVLPTAENDLMNSSKSFEHILQMASSRVSKTLLDSIALLEKDIFFSPLKTQVLFRHLSSSKRKSRNYLTLLFSPVL